MRYLRLNENFAFWNNFRLKPIEDIFSENLIPFERKLTEDYFNNSKTWKRKSLRWEHYSSWAYVYFNGEYAILFHNGKQVGKANTIEGFEKLFYNEILKIN